MKNKIKMICVIEIKKKSNKIYKLFNHGFTNKILCYINGLYDIINNFIKIY